MPQRTLTAHVTGIVYELTVSPGDTVNEGDALMVIESMKMHYALESPCAGLVAEILVAARNTVVEGQAVLTLDSETP